MFPWYLIFLKRSLVFPILLFFSISLHWSLRKAFLSLLVILWNSAFRYLYLSFFPNTEEAEVEWFYEDLQDLLELTPKKDVLFIIGDWIAKVGSQETPEVTGKFGLGIQNEAGQRLIEFCQANALVITNTLFQQYKRRLYTWTSPDGQHPKSDWLYSLQPKMEKLYTVNKNKTRSWLWLRSWTPYFQIQT